MRRIKEVLRLKEGLGLSDTAVSRSVRIARSTVKEYLDRAAAAGLNWETVAELSEEELDRRLFAAVDTRHWDRPLPDWEAVEKELRGRGVTLRLLWLEYLSRHPEGYRYTQFCAHFHAWQRHSRPPTMRRQHRAGEALEVDYAGMTLSVIDKGVVRQAQVFVACLPCSDLTYAEASWTQGHEDWLGAHVRAFAYIGGCPKKVIPDNLKTGVTDANYWDPVLNRSYHALGRHHNVAIVPARVRKPRDKPSAENAVRLVEMWVLAPLRHRQFFSLAEANAALAEKIEEWNNRPFAPPREGSRRSLFEAIERDKLKPLPAAPFVVGQWLVARVNIDYHVAVDGHFYSVPYRLVHRRLDVFLTATAVAIFHQGERVASHPRSAAKAHHTTTSEHMPPAHQAMAKRTPDKLRTEAAALGLAIGTPAFAGAGSMSTVCSTRASIPSKRCAPVSAYCGWSAPTVRNGSNLPANAHSPPASPPRAMSSGCSRPTGGTLSSMPTPRTAWASTAICGVRPTTTELAAPIDAIPNRRE
jgi:transposase